MPAGFEQRQRHMTARKFIVTARAVIGGVTHGATGAVNGRKLTVNIVLPAGRVRHWLHHLVAFHALVFGLRGRPDILVTGEALRIRRRRFCFVVYSEALGMEGRLHARNMRSLVHVARLAFRRPVTCDAIGHQRKRDGRDGLASKHIAVACQAVLLMRRMRKPYVMEVRESRVLHGCS